MEELLPKIHAISGFIILLTGLLQVVMKKSGRAHRFIGRVYAWSWVPLIATGAIIGSFIITFFGLLGFYMVFTGFRFAHLKHVRLSFFDKGFIVLFFLIGLTCLGSGFYILWLGSILFAIITLFFGVIFTLTTTQDILEFILGKKTRKTSGHHMHWYFEHYNRMYISFIAAVTAFSALQNLLGHPLLNWILPTIIGSVLIALTNKNYRSKYKIE
ncbi:MAG: hypothetical protein ACK4K0_09760 [Flavobacteriales bacterium]